MLNQLVDQLVTDGFLLADCFTDYSIFNSPTFAQVHARMLARRDEQPEMKLPELRAEEATRERAVAMYTKHPLVIRGALAGSQSVKSWSDPDWWKNSYSDARVLCTSPKSTGGYTVKEFFDANHFLYVQGATSLFERHPELKDMVESDITRRIAPGEAGKAPLFYQLFMGWKNQGSTVHCAIGQNVFRQIAGRKRWYFFAPSETPYVYPKLYDNGFSATSKTVQHHARGTGTEWFGKLKRYCTVLEPGDVLIVPPWWWHAVENEAGADELVIGVATRYGSAREAMLSDPFKTMVSVVKSKGLRSKAKGHGGDDHNSLAEAIDFEEKLMANRNQTEQNLTLHAVDVEKAA
jgi:hypothetical protein